MNRAKSLIWLVGLPWVEHGTNGLWARETGTSHLRHYW